MSYSIVLHPLVAKDVEAIFNWYESKLAGLGKKFITSLDIRFSEIIINPEAFAKRKRNYRCAVLSDFPYIITFEVDKKSHEIFVSSIFHQRQRPVLRYKRK